MTQYQYQISTEQTVSGLNGKDRLIHGEISRKQNIYVYRIALVTDVATMKFSASTSLVETSYLSL